MELDALIGGNHFKVFASEDERENIMLALQEANIQERTPGAPPSDISEFRAAIIPRIRNDLEWPKRVVQAVDAALERTSQNPDADEEVKKSRELLWTVTQTALNPHKHSPLKTTLSQVSKL